MLRSVFKCVEVRINPGFHCSRCFATGDGGEVVRALRHNRPIFVDESAKLNDAIRHPSRLVQEENFLERFVRYSGRAYRLRGHKGLVAAQLGKADVRVVMAAVVVVVM